MTALVLLGLVVAYAACVLAFKIRHRGGPSLSDEEYRTSYRNGHRP